MNNLSNVTQVEPAHTHPLQWYALKVFYNKVFDVEDLLKKAHVESYIPVEDVVIENNGHRKLRRRPVINSLMFVRTDVPMLKHLLSGPLCNQALVYLNAERNAPAAISEREFEAFRLVTSHGHEGLEYFCDEAMVNLSTGQKVRVIEGPFKGTEGYIKRIRRDRRILVVIHGIVAVATSYIAPEFLEVIDD